MTRTIPEWTGATDDSAIPMRVRVRVFEAYGGVCAACGRRLVAGDTWDCDHIVALANGGANREANLQPLCSWCHKAKTVADVAEKSRIYRKRAKAIGAHRPKQAFAKSKWVRGPDGQTRLRDGTEGKMR